MLAEENSHNSVPSESILWDILASVTDAVITIDEDHKVLVCNKAAEEMFGYPCGEIVGKDVSPLIPNPHQTIHRSYVERYLNTGIPRVIGKARECFGLRKDGSSFPVEISYSVSKTEGRLYFTAVIRDITKRKAMEHEMRFMERFADIGKAVAHVVHEIRKPLMLIGGFARQVEALEVLETSGMARQKLGIIVEEVRRLETLLNGIRLLSRPPASSQKQGLKINQILQDTFELLDPVLQDQQIALEKELDRSLLRVQGDADQLKQVFLNLFYNSIEAMNGVGRILVVSRGSIDTVRITIEDNGPGIPEEVREKIFDPFFTTKSEGSGLGLAISKSIIQEHGGSIVLQPVAPQGVRFIIELPLEGA